jgi:hypothetical protein
MSVHGKALITMTLGLAALVSIARAETGSSEVTSGGKAYANFNLRYEGVNQDNAVQDASALTLRTRLGYKSGVFNGLSALLELEDSRIVGGQDDYTVGPTGFKPGEYSDIADPETTELDQGFLQYNSSESLTVKLGRQVITYDDHRFVGHVGWRQDRQTFDALTAQYQPTRSLTLSYGYVAQRNRIFAEDADIDSKDHFLNAAYATSLGTITGYGYLLEIDDAPSNGLDTWGLSFKGERGVDRLSVLYVLEYASQESDAAGNFFDADYFLVEAGVAFDRMTVRLGYELLGSDGGSYGFSTPLATLHSFNGWSDQFLGTPAEGLEDVYISLNGKLAEVHWILAYHDFSADVPSALADDFGSEIDIQLTREFANNVSVGLKYATYDAGDATAGKVDTDKLWAWFTLEF